MKVVLRLGMLGLWASSVLAVSADAATVKTITTAEISAETMAAAPSCLHYAIQGQCFWLQCGLGGCSVDTTLKVSEYLPDATVSVFNKPSTDPWFLTRTTLDKAALALAKAQTGLLTGDSYGFGNASDVNNHHTEDGRLKEAVMLGNPVATLFHPPLFIPTLSTPLMPYYQSMLDSAAWRSGLTEMFYPASIIPGDQDMGQFPYNVWGSLYPRTGFVDTSNDAKAAAIVAERVASIVTQSGQPHVYVPLQSGSCGQSCTAYSEAVNDPNTIQWQRVYPLAQTMCESFGRDHLAHLMPWGNAATAAGGGNYVWVMWRHYQGCIQDGGTYLGSD